MGESLRCITPNIAEDQLAITTTDSLLIYELSGEKLGAHLKQTIFPPSIDIVPVSFRSAR
jgi:prolactin regulatory element-binding protein